jgi:hypothetical protein
MKIDFLADAVARKTAAIIAAQLRTLPIEWLSANRAL